MEDRRGRQESSTASVQLHSRSAEAKSDEVYTQKWPSHHNPYVEARHDWNDRFLELVNARRNWQLMALLSIALCIVLAFGLVFVTAQQRVTPYLVEVDKLGLAAPVKRLENAPFLSQDLVKYALGRFIKNSRTISFDPMAMKVMFDEAYAYIKGGAVTYLNEYFSKIDPFEISKTESRSVELVSLLPVAEKTWQVRWTETGHAKDGQETSKTAWEAIITVTIEEPKTEAELVKNPIGVFVSQITWTKQI